VIESNPKLARRAEWTRKLELACILRSDCTSSSVRRRRKSWPPRCQRTYLRLPVRGEVKGCATRSRTVAAFSSWEATVTPNVDAVLHFLEDVWPLVKAQLPELRFYVIGSNPPQALRDQAADDGHCDGTGAGPGHVSGSLPPQCRPLALWGRHQGQGGVEPELWRAVCRHLGRCGGMMLKDGEQVLVRTKRVPSRCRRPALPGRHPLRQLSSRGMEFVTRTTHGGRQEEHVRRILDSIGLRAGRTRRPTASCGTPCKGVVA